MTEKSRRNFVKTVALGATGITFAKLIPNADAQIDAALPAVNSLLLDDLPLDEVITFHPRSPNTPQIINVPSAAKSVVIQAYGPGGAGAPTIGAETGRGGGNGGFVQGNFNLGEFNTLVLHVGEGGHAAEATEAARPGEFGGGAGGMTNAGGTEQSAGAGGGYAGVFADETTFVVAGGGGGAGTSSGGEETDGGVGGAGGSNESIARAGDDGQGLTPFVTGEGATITNGGEGATRDGMAEFADSGENGSQLQGGTGANNLAINESILAGGAGGGGGGGFTTSLEFKGGGSGGGAGGGYNDESSGDQEGGGGGGGAGGVSYVNTGLNIGESTNSAGLGAEGGNGSGPIPGGFAGSGQAGRIEITFSDTEL